MIIGAHFLLYSRDAEADRRFLRDVLGFRGVDAGGGWLIFALPPAELAVHPADANFVQRHAERELLGAILYLMCDDLGTAISTLCDRGAPIGSVGQAEWGSFTTVTLPSGGAIGLYQPTHPRAIAGP